jgi:hypothetical protein
MTKELIYSLHPILLVILGTDTSTNDYGKRPACPYSNVKSPLHPHAIFSLLRSASSRYGLLSLVLLPRMRATSAGGRGRYGGEEVERRCWRRLAGETMRGGGGDGRYRGGEWWRGVLAEEALRLHLLLARWLRLPEVAAPWISSWASTSVARGSRRDGGRERRKRETPARDAPLGCSGPWQRWPAPPRWGRLEEEDGCSGTGEVRNERTEETGSGGTDGRSCSMPASLLRWDPWSQTTFFVRQILNVKRPPFWDGGSM